MVERIEQPLSLDQKAIGREHPTLEISPSLLLENPRAIVNFMSSFFRAVGSGEEDSTTRITLATLGMIERELQGLASLGEPRTRKYIELLLELENEHASISSGVLIAYLSTSDRGLADSLWSDFVLAHPDEAAESTVRIEDRLFPLEGHQDTQGITDRVAMLRFFWEQMWQSI